MDGIINISKSSGDTSFTVVAAVRRLCRERRVGHGGTLDPLATGVLPVCIGRATRVTEYLMEHPKTYRAEVEFGLTSDSGDADGAITGGGDISSLTEDGVRSALAGFRGQTQQVPPMFSALKHNGKPLYELARAGITVERAARTIEIYALDLVSWTTPVASIEVTCSRGTYIRSLASDLGQALGCGAYLKGLCRLKYGPFDLDGSVSVGQLKETVRDGDWSGVLHPVDSVLSHLPFLSLPTEVSEFVRHGRSFTSNALGAATEGLAGIQGQARCRAYTLDGSFLGVLRFNSEKDEWQPDKVFL